MKRECSQCAACFDAAGVRVLRDDSIPPGVAMLVTNGRLSEAVPWPPGARPPQLIPSDTIPVPAELFGRMLGILCYGEKDEPQYRETFLQLAALQEAHKRARR